MSAIHNQTGWHFWNWYQHSEKDFIFESREFNSSNFFRICSKKMPGIIRTIFVYSGLIHRIKQGQNKPAVSISWNIVKNEVRSPINHFVQRIQKLDMVLLRLFVHCVTFRLNFIIWIMYRSKGKIHALSTSNVSAEKELEQAITPWLFHKFSFDTLCRLLQIVGRYEVKLSSELFYCCELMRFEL